MRKIRKLYFFDKKNTEEMISFLNNSANDTYISQIMFNPFLPLHHILPQKFKFLPEAYLLKDERNIKGLIAVAPSNNPQHKMEIQKLLFEENAYDDAGELIQFVVSKYKAKGVTSFIVKVDDYLPELLKLFVLRCGFTQISYEKLWRIQHIENISYDYRDIRQYRNSDATAIAALYNESLLPHFRTLLGKDAIEFRECIFKGLSYYTEYKFIMHDTSLKNIMAYISIKTYDNNNFVLDIIQSSWIELDLRKIISFAYHEIQKRKKRFNLFIKTKKYLQYGDKYEQQFINNKYECVQNQIVLTNSSARIIKEYCKTGRFTVLDQFYSRHVGTGTCQ